MTKMTDEREDQVEQLQERVKTLEQRLNDQGLSEDDRIKALEMEVWHFLPFQKGSYELDWRKSEIRSFFFFLTF